MSSRRQILRSVSIVGGAAAINIAIGLVRTKVAALLLGPLGIGQIGLYLNLVQFVATIGALGLGTSAVRQIADALGRDCPEDIASARRALLWLSIGSAILNGMIFIMFTVPIGHLMSIGMAQMPMARWLSIAVGATILSGIPIAMLIGYRRIGDQALVQIGGAALGTLTGLGCIFVWGPNGIVGYIVSAPLTQLACGLIFVLKLPRITAPIDVSRIRAQAVAMVALGVPFTIGALSMTGGMLVLRAMISDRLGLPALGQFTAAWTLCVTYVGFILQATGADYFPRLSSSMLDVDKTHRTITEQFEVSLLISLPIIVAVQAMGPWLLHLLYSSAFTEAVNVVRWQIIGDLFKIAANPIAYIILAAGRGKIYWLGETFAIIVLIAITQILLERLGLAAAGIAYMAMYFGYFIFVLFYAWHIAAFRLSRHSVALFVLALLIVILATGCSMISSLLGLAAGSFLSIGSLVYAIHSLELHQAAMQRWPALARLASRQSNC